MKKNIIKKTFKLFIKDRVVWWRLVCDNARIIIIMLQMIGLLVDEKVS